MVGRQQKGITTRPAVAMAVTGWHADQRRRSPSAPGRMDYPWQTYHRDRGVCCSGDHVTLPCSSRVTVLHLSVKCWKVVRCKPDYVTMLVDEHDHRIIAGRNVFRINFNRVVRKDTTPLVVSTDLHVIHHSRPKGAIQPAKYTSSVSTVQPHCSCRHPSLG